MKSFLSRFEGKPLSKKQIAEAMYLCYINSRDLLDEAKLLKENGRNARAFSLVILALEEFGKIPLICSMILYKADDARSWKKFWRDFTSHPAKQRVFASYGDRLLSIAGKSYKYESLSGVEPLIDKFKQLGFYVSFFEDQLILPENFATENSEWLDWLLGFADERIASLEPFHSSLENSERFLNRAIGLIEATRGVKSRDELEERIREYFETLVTR